MRDVQNFEHSRSADFHRQTVELLNAQTLHDKVVPDSQTRHAVCSQPREPPGEAAAEITVSKCPTKNHLPRRDAQQTA